MTTSGLAVRRNSARTEATARPTTPLSSTTGRTNKEASENLQLCCRLPRERETAGDLQPGDEIARRQPSSCSEPEDAKRLPFFSVQDANKKKSRPN